LTVSAAKFLRFLALHHGVQSSLHRQEVIVNLCIAVVFT